MSLIFFLNARRLINKIENKHITNIVDHFVLFQEIATELNSNGISKVYNNVIISHLFNKGKYLNINGSDQHVKEMLIDIDKLLFHIFKQQIDCHINCEINKT